MVMDTIFAVLTDFAVGGASFTVSVAPHSVVVTFVSAGSFDHFVRWCLDTGTAYSFPAPVNLSDSPYCVALPIS